MRILLVVLTSLFLPDATEAPGRWVQKTRAYGDYFSYYLAQETIDRQVATEVKWYALFAGRYDFLLQLDRANIGPLQKLCRTGNSLSIQDPLQTIIREAKPYRVLAFNEDHVQLRQRLFLLQNLEVFWNAGYRHLGFEALKAGEVQTNDDLSQHAGFHFREPLMAATLRKAKLLGFKTFDYESQEPVQGDAEWDTAINIREAGQAKRIAAYVNGIDSVEKVLLWAGGHHITKSGSTKEEGRVLAWMAGRLMRDHGIEPYTVDLTNCQFTADGEIAAIRGYKTSNGEWFVSDHFARWTVDAQLRLPATREQDYSPGFYRKHIGAQTSVPEALRALGGTLFVQAFEAGQPDTATAFDSILMYDGEDLPLYLPSGEFRLVAYGTDGARLGHAVVTVN